MKLKNAIDTVEKHILFYDNIHFKSESSDITNHEKVKLDKLIKELKNNPSWTINSIGHTDSKGSYKIQSNSLHLKIGIC